MKWNEFTMLDRTAIHFKSILVGIISEVWVIGSKTSHNYKNWLQTDYQWILYPSYLLSNSDACKRINIGTFVLSSYSPPFPSFSFLAKISLVCCIISPPCHTPQLCFHVTPGHINALIGNPNYLVSNHIQNSAQFTVEDKIILMLSTFWMFYYNSQTRPNKYKV